MEDDKKTNFIAQPIEGQQEFLRRWIEGDDNVAPSIMVSVSGHKVLIEKEEYFELLKNRQKNKT